MAGEVCRTEFLPVGPVSSAPQALVGPLQIRVLHIRLLPGSRVPADIALVPDDAMTAFVREGVQGHVCFRPLDVLAWERPTRFSMEP